MSYRYGVDPHMTTSELTSRDLIDKPNEPIGPPPAPGRVVKFAPAFPNINFKAFPIQNPSVNRRHITDIKFVPGSSGRVAVALQTGQVFTFMNSPNASSFEVFLSIVDRLLYREPAEIGFMGLTFDPNFESNGYFYVKYTKPSTVEGTNSIVVSRFRKSPNSFTADPNSERVLFDINRPGQQHHSGSPVFGSDGLLYIPVGDGINCCDTRLVIHPSRNLSRLVGKILRVDVRGSAAQDNSYSPLYTIPPNNPFINKPGALPEARTPVFVLLRGF